MIKADRNVDYSKQINISDDEKRPLMRDRLRIGRFMSFGYHIWDIFEENRLMFNQEKITCETGVELLKEGKFDEFDKLVEETKDHKFVTHNILVEKSKHGDDMYYSIPTLEDLHKVSLHLLEQRYEIGYIQKWDLPKPPTEILEKVATVKEIDIKDVEKTFSVKEIIDIFKEKINSIPNDEDYMIEYKEKQMKMLKSFIRDYNEHDNNNKLYDKGKKAIEEKNGRLAWSILQHRMKYEYEELEIVEPMTVD